MITSVCFFALKKSHSIVLCYGTNYSWCHPYSRHRCRLSRYAPSRQSGEKYPVTLTQETRRSVLAIQLSRRSSQIHSPPFPLCAHTDRALSENISEGYLLLLIGFRIFSFMLIIIQLFSAESDNSRLTVCKLIINANISLSFCICSVLSLCV